MPGRGYAGNLQLKFEIPVHYKFSLGKDKPSQENTSFEPVKQLPGNKKQFPVNGFGVGLTYIFSEWLDLEVTANRFTYSLVINNPYNLEISSANNNIKHDQFSPAFRGNEIQSAYCSRSEKHFLTKQELCSSFSYRGNDSEYMLNNLYSLLGGIRIKPNITNIKITEPYISINMGGVINQSKRYKFDRISTETTLIKKLTSYSFAFELGGGNLIKLNEVIAIDTSLKYFNYGKQLINSSNNHQIKGFKLTLGINLTLN